MVSLGPDAEFGITTRLASRFDTPNVTPFFASLSLRRPHPGGLSPAHAKCASFAAVDQSDEPHTRPEITAALARGVTRVLYDHGLASILEVPLANGRRADLMGLSSASEIWIVETKSCVEDFTVDQKWPDYREYCDRFFFAVTEDFPCDLIPDDVGLIVADGFGGAILRDAPLQRLVGARRKAVTLLFARLAAMRLSAAV